MFYHITRQIDWDMARSRGRYEAPSLATEGFIHLSKPPQILDVANRFYVGQTDLVLLEIDPERLTPEVREEAAADGTGVYPHVHGAINLEAVRAVLPFPCHADGRFRATPV